MIINLCYKILDSNNFVFNTHQETTIVTTMAQVWCLCYVYMYKNSLATFSLSNERHVGRVHFSDSINFATSAPRFTKCLVSDFY